MLYDVNVRLSVTEVHWVAVHAGNKAAAETDGFLDGICEED